MTNQIKVLHIDLEKSLRGGQKQVIHLINELTSYNDIKNYLICKKGSKLSQLFPYKDCLTLSFSGIFDIFSIFKFKKLVKQIEPDIIHYHSSHAHTLGYLALKKKYPEIITRRVHFPPKNNDITREKYKRADKIVCVSQYVKNIMEQINFVDKDKLLVIYSSILPIGNDYDTTYLKKEFNISENAIKFGMLSALQLDKHKDILTILKAVNLLKKSVKNFVFFIVGEGKDRKKIEKLVDEMGIKKHVILTGFRKDIPNILNFLDVYVHSVFNEALGTSILEAMSVGLPILGTKIGGILEIVKDNENGFLFPVNDHATLSLMMKKFVEYPQLKNNFKKINMEKAAFYSSKNMAKKYYQLYKKLLEEL